MGPASRRQLPLARSNARPLLQLQWVRRPRTLRLCYMLPAIVQGKAKRQRALQWVQRPRTLVIRVPRACFHPDCRVLRGSNVSDLPVQYLEDGRQGSGVHAFQWVQRPRTPVILLDRARGRCEPTTGKSRFNGSSVRERRLCAANRLRPGPELSRVKSASMGPASENAGYIVAISSE